MSRNRKNTLTQQEEQLFLFDDEVTQAIKERTAEEDRETRFKFSEVINEEGYIPTAR